MGVGGKAQSCKSYGGRVGAGGGLVLELWKRGAGPRAMEAGGWSSSSHPRGGGGTPGPPGPETSLCLLRSLASQLPLSLGTTN